MDQAERVVLLHCLTPPLVLLHVWCCPAQSLSVYTFTNEGKLLISLRLEHLHLHLVALCGTRDLSCYFFDAVHDVGTLLAHVHRLPTPRLSFSSSTSDSVVGVLFTLGVETGLESTRQSTAITSRMYFGFASTEYPRAVLSITQPKKKIWSPSFSIRPTIRIRT